MDPETTVLWLNIKNGFWWMALIVVATHTSRIITLSEVML